ncbi:MAG: cysteine desulfurase [Deltaproteobacteria bacterium]|nr:cysteine desulfurase [Deltaproteobacteria bacterium]MBW2361396.1 cysteine desulfurase [Deltaproteobacteria bacterium]
MAASPIYLDHHATTPCDPRVLDAMLPWFTERFGNASSATHRYGWEADAAVEMARESLAHSLGAADPRELVFTSGTTESDNLALQGLVRAASAGEPHLVTTAIEHPAVLDVCVALEREGARVTRLPVAGDGRVDPAAVAQAITPQTLLVSVMAANSEIGTLQPLAEIGRICRERGVLFHTDAAQALGKLRLDVEALGIDLLSACAHKLYGPKGVGLLYVRDRRPRIRLLPLLYGGGHERGLRSGSLPVPLVVGFARAVELCLEELPGEADRLTALRERLWNGLRAGLPDLRRNGHPSERLPGNLNVCIPGLEADALIAALKDVALSSGSACASASGEASHVLAALGLSDSAARASLRFGLGRGTTQAQIDIATARVVEEARALRERGPRSAGLRKH